MEINKTKNGLLVSGSEEAIREVERLLFLLERAKKRGKGRLAVFVKKKNGRVKVMCDELIKHSLSG